MSMYAIFVIGNTDYQARKWAKQNITGGERQPVCSDSFDVLRGSRYRTVVLLPGVEVPEHLAYMLCSNTVIRIPVKE